MLFDVFKRKPIQKPKRWQVDYDGGAYPWKLRRWENNAERYKLIDLFTTKEEALAKLEEIKDSPYYYD